MGKKCHGCRKKCSGQTLKIDGDKYFHVDCFKCAKCDIVLHQTGFFGMPDGTWLCPTHHQQATRQLSVDVVASSAVRQSPSFRESSVVRERDTQPAEHHDNHNHAQQQQQPPQYSPGSPLGSPVGSCVACQQPLTSGQLLIALAQNWHVWCFKCVECQQVLHGEYMAKDGQPYCLRDYNTKFGVKCYECSKFIAGKVLQAGNFSFHPTCARCTRCGEHFGDGEEMYVQGDEIWHPSCGAANVTQNIAPSGAGHAAAGRAVSPVGPKYQSAFGQHVIYMYMLPQAEQPQLRHPIVPQQPPPPQFHVPQAPIKIRKSRLAMLKTGMQRLTEDLATDADKPRPKSPHMDNEEPIELAHFPAAKPAPPDAVPPIEREDFPAPPFPYAVEEIKRRLSSSSIENEVDDDQFDEGAQSGGEDAVAKLERTVRHLDQFEKESSMAHVIKQNFEESAKKQRLPLHWDPRNAARTASAKKMPALRLRYDTPINASPSRHLNRPRPWERYQDGTSGLDRAATMNAVPCWHLPESRGGTLASRAATCDGYGVPSGRRSAADGTITSTYSEHSLREASSAHTTPAKGAPPPLAARTSLPDLTKPVQCYDLDTLQLDSVTKELPDGVDRQHLERHLTREVFETVFGMTRIEFYKLPEWKRINLKRKAALF